MKVFSHRVSAVMNFLASQKTINPKAVDTSKFLLFFDKLFDSLNGSFSKVVNGKIYRTSVIKNFVYHKLWAKSSKVMSSMKFVGNETSLCSNSTKLDLCNKGVSKTLEEKGLKSLLLRNLIQDPLENVFGAARSMSCSNLTCSRGAFISIYKTLMLNNLTSSHSPGANCEEDFNESCLTNYKNLFSSKLHSNNFGKQFTLTSSV